MYSISLLLHHATSQGYIQPCATGLSMSPAWQLRSRSSTSLFFSLWKISSAIAPGKKQTLSERSEHKWQNGWEVMKVMEKDGETAHKWLWQMVGYCSPSSKWSILGTVWWGVISFKNLKTTSRFWVLAKVQSTNGWKSELQLHPSTHPQHIHVLWDMLRPQQPWGWRILPRLMPAA